MEDETRKAREEERRRKEEEDRRKLEERLRRDADRRSKRYSFQVEAGSSIHPEGSVSFSEDVEIIPPNVYGQARYDRDLARANTRRFDSADPASVAILGGGNPPNTLDDALRNDDAFSNDWWISTFFCSVGGEEGGTISELGRLCHFLIREHAGESKADLLADYWGAEGPLKLTLQESIDARVGEASEKGPEQAVEEIRKFAHEVLDPTYNIFKAEFMQQVAASTSSEHATALSTKSSDNGQEHFAEGTAIYYGGEPDSFGEPAPKDDPPRDDTSEDSS